MVGRRAARANNSGKTVPIRTRCFEFWDPPKITFLTSPGPAAFATKWRVFSTPCSASRVGRFNELGTRSASSPRFFASHLYPFQRFPFRAKIPLLGSKSGEALPKRVRVPP